MELQEARVDGRRITLLGICEGLVGEADRVLEVLEDRAPDVVALGLADEMVDQSPSWDVAEELGTEDEAYATGLSVFGEVRLPAGAYGAVVQRAQGRKLPVVGVDLSESRYTDLFTERISIWDLFWRSRWLKKLEKRPPETTVAEAFCRAFDQAANKGPFALLEEAREGAMAQGIREASDRGEVLAVLPVARLDGVLSRLQDPARAVSPSDP